MFDSKSKHVKSFLQKPDIHNRWDSSYYIPENEKFYEQAFTYITNYLNAPPNSTILDAGCGSCEHSVRLANRGFFVHSVDFSESVLKRGKAKVKAKGLEPKVRIQTKDLCALSFQNNSFQYILCWGVLMHIPDVGAAISELARVLKPDGMLVVGENNMYSLQGMARLCLRRFLKKKEVVRRTPEGIEYWWSVSDTDLIMSRHSNMRKLIDMFRTNGLIVRKRLASQFTDLYTRFPSRMVNRLIHALNDVWFFHVKSPHLAIGNILIFQKE